MKAALLPDRGIVKVAGETARQFLNGLLTADITKVTPERPGFAALLTPQGKIVVDCIVVEQPTSEGGGFLLDCPRALAGELVDKLKFYRLRAKVTFDDLSGALGVLAFWGGSCRTAVGLVYPDPRLPELGSRVVLPPERAGDAAAELGAELVEADAYEAHRIALGVPRGGVDFAYGDAFPHETDMDQLNGVDFAKGCFVGQEVVSRIEHRGSARKRIVQVTADGVAPEAGLPVTAGDKQIGTMGSAVGAQGLAMLRLDYIAEAQASGAPIVAGGVPIRPRKPAWARFDWPQKAAE
ncbi:MAG TPA: folate-binding protein [Xanthobacteraceae bacterium]|nr:folate-binding protein [Xanthobacteraceae bacterium]